MTDDNYRDTITRVAVDNDNYMIAQEVAMRNNTQPNRVLQQCLRAFFNDDREKKEHFKRVEKYAELNGLKEQEALEKIIKSIVEPNGEIKLPARKLIND